jgi:hypothetical protein
MVIIRQIEEYSTSSRLDGLFQHQPALLIRNLAAMHELNYVAG